MSRSRIALDEVEQWAQAEARRIADVDFDTSIFPTLEYFVSKRPLSALLHDIAVALVEERRAGLAAEQRAAQGAEAVRLLARLLRNDRTIYQDHFYQFVDCGLERLDHRVQGADLIAWRDANQTVTPDTQP